MRITVGGSQVEPIGSTLPFVLHSIHLIASAGFILVLGLIVGMSYPHAVVYPLDAISSLVHIDTQALLSIFVLTSAILLLGGLMDGVHIHTHSYLSH